MPISTNKEFINASLKRFGVEETDVDLIMAEHPELDPDGKVDHHVCKVAMYESMSAILPAMSHNVSEGGYSVTWNIEAIKMWYSALCRELGRNDVLTLKRPKVRNRSNCW